MNGKGAVCVSAGVELFAEFMPVVAGAAVVKAVKAKTAIAVCEDRRVAVAMGAVKRAFGEQIFCAHADGDLLDNLYGML